MIEINWSSPVLCMRAREPLTLDFLGEGLMTTTLLGRSLKTCYLFHMVFLRAMNGLLSC